MSAYPPHTELTFPSLSPTMTHGNLAVWHKKEGDEVAAGDLLADIETDKATMAFETQDDGFLAKILLPEGAKDVPVGQVVAILVEEASDVPKFANYSAGAAGGAAAPSPSGAAAAPSPPQETGSPAPDVPYKLLDMPALSPTMSSGSLVSWLVKVGDEISPGQLLAEIETDKATLPFENQDDGFIASLLVEAGATNISVGSPLAVIVEEAGDVEKMAGWTPGTTSPATAEAAASAAVAEAEVAPPTGDNRWAGRVGPAAQLILGRAGILPSKVAGTGPRGLVTKGDALAAAAGGGLKPSVSEKKKAAAAPANPSPASPPAAAPPASEDPAEYVDIPMTQMRRVIASRLLESKTTIPAMYMRMEVPLDEVTAMRNTLKEQGTKVSVNDFVIRAVALALMDVPEVNTTWDAKTASAVQHPAADISVAVATPGGLITPIVKGANSKTLQQISADVKDLAGRARENKLKPEEFVGGSFSVSNLGMFGTDAFYAIINPPQCCIMAVGGAQSKTVLNSDGQPATKSVMAVSISADNRAIDELAAARFLEAFAGYFAAPFRMIL